MFKGIPGRIAFAVVVSFVIALSLTACGGGNNTIAQAEKEQAEKHGREVAQEKAKEQRLELKLAKLERENRQAKKRHRGSERRKLKEEAAHVSPSDSTGSSSVPAPSAPSTPSGTDCGGGTIAGPETSCGFALNVRSEYESFVGSGSGSIEAFSEANEQWYDMYCTVGSYHECTGAISATVYWP